MHLLLRADASAQMGIGHIMRCLALAQACQAAGGQASFALAAPVPTLEARLAAENCPATVLDCPPGGAEDEAQTVALAREAKADWVAVDGYQFGADYQRTLKQAGLRLLFIDDYGHAEHYAADLVLNQNLAASETLYTHREPYTQLLLGARYIMLRREFWPWQGHQRQAASEVKRVLVTMGGSDTENLSLTVLQALEQTTAAGVEVVVAIGATNPHRGVLQAHSAHSRLAIRLVQSAVNMSELMAEADVAISAAGSTAWELASMGVPMLLLVLYENQRGVAGSLQAAGAALSLDKREAHTADHIAQALAPLLGADGIRRRLTWRGQALIDGRGAARVAQCLQTTSAPRPAEPVTVRPATVRDALFLWELANDPTARANSFSPAAIPLAQHLTWYQAKLQSAASSLWIVEANGEPVAQIRYDQTTDAAEIDFSVAPAWRGHGLGTQALRLTRLAACQQLNARRCVGIVRDFNTASARAFLSAGYRQIAENAPVHDYPCYIFEWVCPGENSL